MEKYEYPARPCGEVDLIRNAFLKETCPRKRNFLIKKLIKVWLPHLDKKIRDFSATEQDEIRQIYRCRVLDLVYKFKGRNGASFKSYLYYAAKGALDIYLGFGRKVRFEIPYSEIDTQSPQLMSALINETFITESYTHSTSKENQRNVYYSEAQWQEQFVSGALDLDSILAAEGTI